MLQVEKIVHGKDPMVVEVGLTRTWKEAPGGGGEGWGLVVAAEGEARAPRGAQGHRVSGDPWARGGSLTVAPAS